MKYGEKVDYGRSRGVYTTVSDEEHVAIIVEYPESSMMKLGEKMGRFMNMTIQVQVHEHDKAVEENGYCIR